MILSSNEKYDAHGRLLYPRRGFLKIPIIRKSLTSRSYGWSMSEVEELKRASLLLAADVIYSDDLTDALFSILEVIMSSSQEKVNLDCWKLHLFPGFILITDFQVLYLALEKRYNFSIDDLDVVANGYSHFRSYLKGENAYLVLKRAPII